MSDQNRLRKRPLGLHATVAALIPALGLAVTACVSPLKSREVASVGDPRPSSHAPIVEAGHLALRLLGRPTNAWPEFQTDDLRLGLIDTTSGRAPLLVGINAKEIASSSVEIAPDLLYFPRVRVPERSIIVQCSSADKGPEWADYRCDFFPALQSLFNKDQKEILFFEVPDRAQATSRKIQERIKAETSPYILTLHSWIHESFHGHQERIEFLQKVPPSQITIESCFERASFRADVLREVEAWAPIANHILSVGPKGLEARIAGILNSRGKSDPECWQTYRTFERWEGVTNFVADQVLYQSQIWTREQMAKFWSVLAEDVSQNIHASYYLTGALIAHTLEHLEIENWQSLVNQGQDPQTLLSKAL